MKRSPFSSKENLMRTELMGELDPTATPNFDYDESSSTSSSTALKKHSQNLRDDWFNVLLLTSLYFIQGIPMGFCFGAVPLLLQNKLTYTQLGFFSLAQYPYSLKLLWSPIVDSYYVKCTTKQLSSSFAFFEILNFFNTLFCP